MSTSQMSNQDRATKFADFVNSVTNYAPLLDQALVDNQPTSAEEVATLFEYLSKITPVLNLDCMADLSFRDAVMVWTHKTADEVIAKAVTALLIRPLEDFVENPDTVGTDKAQGLIQSAGAASAIAIMFDNNNLAFDLLGRVKHYCVTNDIDFPNFHRMLVDGLLLSVVDDEQARDILTSSVAESDTEALWDNFSVELDEAAMWHDLRTTGDSNE